jgi:hypothetical protein
MSRKPAFTALELIVLAIVVYTLALAWVFWVDRPQPVELEVTTRSN